MSNTPVGHKKRHVKGGPNHSLKEKKKGEKIKFPVCGGRKKPGEMGENLGDRVRRKASVKIAERSLVS